MGKHQCTYCSYETPFISSFKRHLKVKHNVQPLRGGKSSCSKNDLHVEGPQYIHSPQYVNLQAPAQHSFNLQSTEQDPFIPYDIRLKENFKLFISGPSRCGKTFFVSDLLDNIETFAKEPPKKIIYVYKVWQPKFEEMRSLVHVFLEDCESILAKIQERATGQSMLVVFDDLLNSKSLVDIATLFTVDGRHMNMSLVFLTQRMFVNNEPFRQISQNCDYFAIFKNPRNSSEIRTLAQQLTPGSLELTDIYMQATQDPFSYLFINLTQECQPQVKYLSKLFDYDNSVRAYCADLHDSNVKKKTHFKEISLVDTSFFNKVSNENHILVTNTFSPIHGKEIVGTKNDDCTECESPAPPQPSWSNPSTSKQPPPSQPHSVHPSTPSPALLPYQEPPPSRASSQPSAQLEGVKPFESEAHQWIDNVAYDMEVDPLLPQSRFTNAQYMGHSSRPQHHQAIQYSEPILQQHKPQTLQYHEPQVLQYHEPQALTYRLQEPEVEMETLAFPDPKYSLWNQNEQEASKQVVQKPILRSADVEIEALPTPKEHTLTIAIPSTNEYSSFLCTLCNTYFNTRKTLERHNKNIHDAYQQKRKGIKHEAMFTCDICYDEFKSQKVLDRHVKNIHAAFLQNNKGIKRQMEKEDKYPQKYVKWTNILK